MLENDTAGVISLKNLPNIALNTEKKIYVYQNIGKNTVHLQLRN